MYLLKTWYSIGVLLFFTSCAKEVAEYPVVSSMKEPPIITGIFLKDAAGNMQGLIGEPNVNTGSYWQPKIIALPNPCREHLRLMINSQSTGSVRIWMACGKFEGATADLNNQILWSNSVNIVFDKTIASIPKNSIDIDLTNVPDGYYRLYVDMEGTTYWDNIWIDKNQF